ncbi:hypothetical protein H4R21_000310 [Coemansia helicoidea]|uniref:Uncharacterized protein n=1 Tax=Coemansia helicoidea TaxID=1286919 RepID=A0ACC1LGP6_9FUNG|nr:hypothetical protein H4R21_000310 [Coemansia helicoidea]
MAGIIKNNPRSILVAWAGIMAVGFGAFAFSKDLVNNERRAESIRRIKRERRLRAYQEYNKARDDEEDGSDAAQ